MNDAEYRRLAHAVINHDHDYNNCEIDECVRCQLLASGPEVEPEPVGDCHLVPAAPATSAVTEGLVEMLRSRSAAGLKKYGVTLDREDLTFDEWMHHLLEELLDAAGYVQSARRTAKK